MKRIAATLTVLVLLAFATYYAYFTGKFNLLTRSRRSTVEVNGVSVGGEVLEGRLTALVTRREKGKEHSYLLSYAGDVDPTGNIGYVIDCHDWIAPRLPVLIQTSDYPNCRVQPEDHTEPWGWSLTVKGGAEQFVTASGDVISIRRRNR